MRNKILSILMLLVVSCSQLPKQYWQPYDEGEEILINSEHDIPRMRYKIIQSKFLDKNTMWAPFEAELTNFDLKYEEIKPLILEQDIPTIQQKIVDGHLSYELLTKFFLYRIRLFESNPETTLHAVLALNPDVINQAKLLDTAKFNKHHPIYGMPILLKDNINTSDMNTTAGAAILKDHKPIENAFVVKQLIQKGALILGKVNLSEWAYYFCDGCPVGYSAVGGQTLNPYGRKIFETGGSSSGSGVAVAANYAVAALGSETSGSILSPSAQNSVVGLKPTIGLVSRSGIIPISNTLDTSGPMTKNVLDNAIILDAIAVQDYDDKITVGVSRLEELLPLKNSSLDGVRLGAMTNLIELDSLYRNAIYDLKSSGAEIITFTPEKVSLNGFSSVLNSDMKHDLPNYFREFSSIPYENLNTQEIIDFNSNDSMLYMPYGQDRFYGVMSDTTSKKQVKTIINSINEIAINFFNVHIIKHDLDAILSVNNYYAGHAALAFYPCLTIPMGYNKKGEPKNLTFITPSFNEKKLLEIGRAYEDISRHRKLPKGYE